MQTIRRYLERWALIAIFAVVGMTLAPTVSQAVIAASGVQWVEICSATGSRWVQLESSPGQGRGSNMVVDMAKCPACCHLGDSAGLTPAPWGLLAFVGGSQRVPTPFLHAPRPSRFWALSQPRGPPAFA